MKDFWLIRHAESLANIGETTSTTREMPLTHIGLKAADELANSIDDRPDLIVISPYTRSRQTAEPFFELYPDVEIETSLVQEFTYLSVSRCRGNCFEGRKPWVKEYWDRSDPVYCDGDQSESFAEFIGRCSRFVLEMREREFELAFVFTHEQFIKGVLWYSMRLGCEMSSESMKSFQKLMVSFSIPNTAIVKVKVDEDGQFYFGKIGNV